MKTRFRTSFGKDLKAIAQNKNLLKRIEELIGEVEKAPNPSEIANFTKLKVGANFYRIKIGDYRVGLVLKGDLVTFVRVLHRKDMYRYFP